MFSLFQNKNFESTLKDVNFNTFNGVAGVQGAGKTLFLTALAYLYANDRIRQEKHNSAVFHLKNGGYKLDYDKIVIPSYNINLQKRGRSPIFLNKQEISDYLAFKKHCSSSSLIILDEAQDEFNAREWQQTDRRAGRFCEFARHFDLTIFFSAQNFESIDKTFRGYTKIFYVVNSCAVNFKGEKSKKGQKFKNVDIEHIEIDFYEFESYEQYKKFLQNRKIFSFLFIKKLIIRSNLFQMYNHDYLKELFLEKERHNNEK